MTLGARLQRFAKRRHFASRSLSAIASIALAFAVVIGLLAWLGQDPFTALGDVVTGALGNAGSAGDTLMAWVPLTLAAAGLTVTFAAGLWNIGIEGQVAAGGIAAEWVGRSISGGPFEVIPLMFVTGAVGGCLWALVTGVLKTRGKVNEIFGGLGLDFVASGLAVYLIIGPWHRQGIASTSGTNILPSSTNLPVISGTRLSLVAVAFAVLGVLFVYLLLRGTRFGLRLKAVGRNRSSAALLGIPTERYLLASFALCGALAGIAGVIQVAGVWHKLVPSISGGYGFLAILVALLAAFRALPIGPIAFFFAMAAVGSIQLTLIFNLNAAMGNVLVGIVALFVVLGGGIQRSRAEKRARAIGVDERELGLGASLSSVPGEAPVESIGARG
jgi:general nucleoside transport system permease protein